MKIALLHYMGAYAEGVPTGWPVSGRWWNADRGRDALARSWKLVDLAVASGFDMVTVTEHHYTNESVAPNPVIMGAALSQRYPDVKIGMLGPTLPLWNPVRLAEDIATVDMLSGGRTLLGLFRGTPTEHMAMVSASADTRALHNEAFDLLLRCWTAEEPFSWHGEHYDFDTVAVWPRPLQYPHPPIFVAGTRAEVCEDAARRHLSVGLHALAGPPAVNAKLAQRYRAAAEAAGWTPTAEDVLWRARVYVADSDEAAQADIKEHGVGDQLRGMVPSDPEELKALDKRWAAANDGVGLTHMRERSASRMVPDMAGSPETVVKQFLAAHEEIGFGIADLRFDGITVPFEKISRSLELFSREVLPAIRSELARRGDAAVASPGGSVR